MFPILLANKDSKNIMIWDYVWAVEHVLFSTKGWEPTFLIRAFGLSEELSTEVGFAFSNNGLKSQDLRFRMKKKQLFDIFDNVS